jgi:GAF domain-containing protein
VLEPAADGERDPALLAQELGAAQEHLRLADDELRAQARQIEELLGERVLATAQRYWLLSMLPVPVITTDRFASIVTANAAAAAFLRVSVVTLVRQPLQAYVHVDDRRSLQTVLGTLGPGAEEVTARLLPRGGLPTEVRLAAAAEGTDLVTWMVLGTPVLRELEVTHGLGLAAAVAALSQLRAEQGLSQDVLHRVVDGAAVAVPAATSISLHLGSPLEPESIASTAPAAAHADGLQVMVGEGPCASAYEGHVTVVSGALREDDRWPRFAARLEPDDVASVLSVPLESDDAVLGAFNCYSDAADAFDERDLRVAELLAHAVAAVITSLRQKDELRELTEQLHAALDSRAVIDQAKGVIMANRGVSSDDAFEHLRELSQRGNVKLREVAQLVVDQAVAAGRTGTVGPGTAPRRGAPQRR